MLRRSSLLLLGSALLLTACGTTVPVTSTVGTGSGDGLSPAVQGGGIAAPGSSSTGAATGSAVLPGGGTPAATTSGAAGTAGTTTGATSLPGAAHGGSKAPVRVGLLYVDGADAVASGLGISGLSTGDTVAQAKAIVGYLNARGGLGGRPIDLRLGRLPASQLASDQAGTHAAACASLTEDAKVSYVVSYVQLTSSVLSCYVKHGVTVLDDQSGTPDPDGARMEAAFGAPGELALGRAARELVDALWRTHWLTASSKVGTFVFDTPDGVALETRYLVPALAAHGLKPAASARESTSADGANQSGTVLKFRSAGVDRVIPLGASPLFLMNAAESQGYRPAYAMTSTFGPGALLEGAAPRNQLHGAAGIGWSKYLDIGSGPKPGAVSTNETLCFSIMQSARQQSSSSTVKAFQAALCNVLMFLKAGVDRYGTTDVLGSIRSQGLAFPPADAFAIHLAPGRADGVAAYRDLVFQDGCGCFAYAGSNRPAT